METLSSPTRTWPDNCLMRSGGGLKGAATKESESTSKRMSLASGSAMIAWLNRPLMSVNDIRCV